VRTHCLLSGVVAILIAAAPALVSAQRGASQDHHHKREHRGAHYRLFDMGTLGGPASSYFFRNEIVNDRGDATGYSDSTTATRNDSDFACLDRFVVHAFVWHKGHMQLLPGLSENGCSLPVQISDRGDVIGISQNGILDPLTGFVEDRAVVWRDGEIQDLGTLGGHESLATAINRDGQIVGWSENGILDPVSLMGETQTRAFLWDEGRMLDLGTLGGPDAYAVHINDEGQVVGGSYVDATVHPITGLPTVVPFLWCRGRMKNLGHLGGTFSEAVQINNRGQVLGDGTVAGDLETHPTFWEDDRLTDLNLASRGGSLLTGNWLNQRGEIVGAADFTSVGGPAFGGAVWKKGNLINVDPEDSDCGVEAWGLNDRGQAVGSAICSDESHAWLWSDGHTTDLNDLVPADAPLRLVYGIMIGNHGDIVGIGVPAGVSDADALASGHAFVLAVVDDEEDDDDEDRDSASPAVPLPRRVAGFHAQGFHAPIKEAMMKLHERVAAQLHPLSLRKRSVHPSAPR
jgi:probable HAF family extracellular repeat protein